MLTAKVAASLAPLKIVAFFATNPDEHLHTKDMAAKVRMSVENLRPIARRMRLAGWLDADIQQGPGCGSVWRAGPALLRAIGAKSNG